MKLKITLVAWLGMLALLALVTASPAVTSTAVAVRPSAEVGEHVPFPCIVDFNFKTLVTWGSSSARCTVPSEVISGESWSCLTSVVYTVGSVLIRFFDGKELPFKRAHTHHYPATETISTLRQLTAAYDGREPVRALSCNEASASGCYNVYYTNYLHTDGERIVHKFEARGSSKKLKRRQVMTETVGIDSEDSDTDVDIFGWYHFMDKNEGWEALIGDDHVDDFAWSFAQAASEGAFREEGFRQKTAFCANTLGTSVGNMGNPEVATSGFVTVNDNDHPPIDEEGWMALCDDLGNDGWEDWKGWHGA